MNNLIKSTRTFVSKLMRVAQMSLTGGQSGSSGSPGSAGAIREAGGAFGKLGAAKEAEYFYKQQMEQLKKLTHRDVTSKEFQENDFDKFKNK